MALVKNTLLFGGWVPTLLGGAGGVWWLTSDKTVEDALRRTNLRFLHSKEDFERIYEKFEDDPNLLKDIPEVATLKGKAIDEWCDDKLQLSLSEENVKDVIAKATRYCMSSEKIVSGLSGFRKFENILSLLGDSKVSAGNMQALIMSHLGDDPSKDVYYMFNSSEDAWKITQTSRERTFEKKLYIDDRYEILSTKHSTDLEAVRRQSAAWEAKAEEYDSAPENEKMPWLNYAMERKYQDSGFIQGQTDGIRRNNLLKVECMALLNKRFTDEEKLKEAEKYFTRWCTTRKTGK